MLLAVALALPASSGAAGAATAHGLIAAFGAAAWLAPLVVALAGAIIFLEINVPQMIATFGIAALLYFAIVDAAFARRGGACRQRSQQDLHAPVVGDAGGAIVLVLAAVVVTVWITRLSVKRAIGWSLVTTNRARNAVTSALRALRPAPARATSTTLARPASLREAFGLPPIAPVDVRTFVAQAAPAAPAVPIPAARVQPDDEGDFEGDEDEDFDDDLEDDDEELDDGDFEGDDEEDDEDETVDRAPVPVVAASPVPLAAIATAAIVAGTREYRLPDLALFDPAQVQTVDESTRSHVLEDTLASFGVGAKVVHIERGPSVTRYELRPERGVKISRISSLADDIALALAATAVRIEAPFPG